MFRLNSRDHFCDQSKDTDSPDTAFNLSSIQFESVNEVYGSKSSQRSVSVTVHRSSSTTLNFGRSKSDHDVETTVRG